MSKFGVSGFGPGSYVLPDCTKFTIERNQLAQDADAARKRQLLADAQRRRRSKEHAPKAQVLQKKKARAEAREKKKKARAEVSV
jgi:topoisomerase IA-like protein